MKQQLVNQWIEISRHLPASFCYLIQSTRVIRQIHETTDIKQGDHE